MKDGDLIKISFIITIIGVIALFLVAQQIKPIDVTAAIIDETYVGKNVVINDTIKSLTTKDGNIFITLDEGLRVVIFRNRALDEYYNLKAKDKISVIGKVQLYKNELEIIAEEITRIS